MAQFDVYLRRNRARSYMLDVQTDLMSDFDTRLIVPLIPKAAGLTAIGRLHPVFAIDDVSYLMATHLATAVPRREFGEHITSLAEYRDEIIAAIDFLTTGV